MFKKYSGVIWNSLGTLTFAANSVLLSMFVTRVSGVEIGGDFGLSLTTSQLLYFIGIFGMNTFQMTDHKKEYGFKDYFAVKTIMSFAMMFFGVIVSLFYIDYEYRSVFILFLTTYMAIHSFAELYQSFYFQNKRLDLSGRSLCFRTLSGLIAFTFVLMLSENTTISVIVMIFTSLVAGYFFTVRPKKMLQTTDLHFKKDNIAKIIKATFPLFLSTLLMNLMLNTSRYAIDFYYDREIQGYLNIIFMPIMVINLFSSFIFIPTLNQYISNLKNKLYAPFFKMMKTQIFLIFALTLFCTIVAWLIGDYVLGFFYGVDVSVYKNEIAFIVFNGSLVSIAALLYNVLTIMRAQKYILYTYFISAPICLILSFILAPKFEIMGVMSAFFISHLVVVLVELMIILKKYKYTEIN